MSVSLGESSTPSNARVYAIGDIHGHRTLLESMYEQITDDLKARPVSEYKIIFLGDYIDRGPDSSGCVDYLIALLKKNSNVLCLKGNHEAKLENFLDDPIAFADSFFTYGGTECSESYGVNMASYRGTSTQTLEIATELKERIPEEHINFYANLHIHITLGDYFFTHAGIRPNVSLPNQTDQDLMTIRSEFLSHQALFEKVIVHGHTPTYPMEVLPNRINVDTHAYHTGVLSCIVLEDVEHHIIEAKQ